MPFKVQIGPPQISIHQGQTVLISEPDGQINWPSERGLYFLDTRVVSSWAVYANGETWELLNGGAITYYAARIFLTNRSFATENGTIPPRTHQGHRSYRLFACRSPRSSNAFRSARCVRLV
jgi:glycogen debranching enzyme-like protein